MSKSVRTTAVIHSLKCLCDRTGSATEIEHNCAVQLTPHNTRACDARRGRPHLSRLPSIPTVQAMDVQRAMYSHATEKYPSARCGPRAMASSRQRRSRYSGGTYQPKPSCSGTMIAIAVSSAKNTTRHTRLPHTTRNCLEPAAAATRKPLQTRSPSGRLRRG